MADKDEDTGPYTDRDEMGIEPVSDSAEYLERPLPKYNVDGETVELPYPDTDAPADSD